MSFADYLDRMEKRDIALHPEFLENVDAFEMINPKPVRQEIEREKHKRWTGEHPQFSTDIRRIFVTYACWPSERVDEQETSVFLRKFNVPTVQSLALQLMIIGHILGPRNDAAYPFYSNPWLDLLCAGGCTFSITEKERAFFSHKDTQAMPGFDALLKRALGADTFCLNEEKLSHRQNIAHLLDSFAKASGERLSDNEAALIAAGIEAEDVRRFKAPVEQLLKNDFPFLQIR